MRERSYPLAFGGRHDGGIGQAVSALVAVFGFDVFAKVVG